MTECHYVHSSHGLCSAEHSAQEYQVYQINSRMQKQKRQQTQNEGADTH